MGDVVQFKKPEVRYMVAICDGDLKSGEFYQTFEADSITRPELTFVEHQVWYGTEKIYVPGPSVWGPITIEGPDEIGEAIRNSNQPPRVTFESIPRAKNWWELHNVYLSVDSEEGKHIIHFDNCTEHQYGRKPLN